MREREKEEKDCKMKKGTERKKRWERRLENEVGKENKWRVWRRRERSKEEKDRRKQTGRRRVIGGKEKEEQRAREHWKAKEKAPTSYNSMKHTRHTAKENSYTGGKHTGDLNTHNGK